MIITEIKPINSKRSKIYIDGEFAFVLYKGEIRRYGFAEGEAVREEDYEEIVQEVLLKRGKARALHLLQSMERTEGQLRSKLREGGYPEEVIEQVLEYVKGYHYVDDTRYAAAYLNSRSKTKSIRQIQMELQAKGISKELIKSILEEQDEVDESVAIRRWIQKKKIDVNNASREQLQKFYQFLLRKGFKYEDIQSELRLYGQTDTTNGEF